MGQRIKLKIGGKEYELVAETPEMEQLMRLAADEVDVMLADYNVRFPGADVEDKMVMIAIREGVGKFYANKQLDLLQNDIDSLGDQLKTYLRGTKEK